MKTPFFSFPAFVSSRCASLASADVRHVHPPAAARTPLTLYPHAREASLRRCDVSTVPVRLSTHMYHAMTRIVSLSVIEYV